MIELGKAMNKATFFAQRLGITEIEFLAAAQGVALGVGNIDMCIEIEDVKRAFIPNFDEQVNAMIAVAQMVGIEPLELLADAQAYVVKVENVENVEQLELLTMIKCKIIEDGFYQG